MPAAETLARRYSAARRRGAADPSGSPETTPTLAHPAGSVRNELAPYHPVAGDQVASDREGALRSSLPGTARSVPPRPASAPAAPRPRRAAGRPSSQSTRGARSAAPGADSRATSSGTCRWCRTTRRWATPSTSWDGGFKHIRRARSRATFTTEELNRITQRMMAAGLSAASVHRYVGTLQRMWGRQARGADRAARSGRGKAAPRARASWNRVPRAQERYPGGSNEQRPGTGIMDNILDDYGK